MGREMKNPFVLNIYPDLIVGYEKQKDELLTSLHLREKYIIVYGDLGVGKTTLAKWVAKQTNMNVIYLPRPSKPLESYISSPKNLFKKLFNLFNPQKDVLLIVDEFNESDKDFVDELMSLIDNNKRYYVLLISLNNFKNVIKDEYPMLYDRITHEIYLNNLNKNEVFQLIKRRVEFFGGNGIEPFTSDVIEHIYNLSGGNPRSVLKLASFYYRSAYERGVDIIDKSFVESLNVSLETKNNFSNNFSKSTKEISSTSHLYTSKLTKKQQEILDLIKSKGALSPPEIVPLIDKSEYASELHALRAVNNILRKLESLGYVKRKREGRRYVYFV